MGIINFFSNQARKPSGFFGRYIVSRMFENGNAVLNTFVFETMDLRKDDIVLEIGFGPGKLIHRMAGVTESGRIDGVDFSDAMHTVARKRNLADIRNERVALIKGDFDKMDFQPAAYNKICSVNTIYFWPDPAKTADRIYTLLKPGGRLVLGLKIKKELEKQSLSREVFHLYESDEILNILTGCRFRDIQIRQRKTGKSVCHCISAVK